MGYETIQVRRLSGALGAEIEGLDLTRPLSDREFAELHDAFLVHQVVFLRNQALDDAQHLALARRFGEPGVYPALRVLGVERPLEIIEDTQESPPKADGWHTDISWLPEPPKIGILSARVIPEYGGDTLWVDLHRAYDALSPAMRCLVESLTVHHAPNAYFYQQIRQHLPPETAERIEREFGAGADHPLVRTHPETGRRALYVAGYWMDHVVGMHPAESELLLRFLMDHATQPRLQCRWRWRADDLALWDERCTMHLALPDHYPQHRRMRRCTVDGDRPFFRPD